MSAVRLVGDNGLIGARVHAVKHAVPVSVGPFDYAIVTECGRQFQGFIRQADALSVTCTNCRSLIVNRKA
jgi:predicted component of type VI protein secretion system